jgi:hypothetical protein
MIEDGGMRRPDIRKRDEFPNWAVEVTAIGAVCKICTPNRLLFW